MVRQIMEFSIIFFIFLNEGIPHKLKRKNNSCGEKIISVSLVCRTVALQFLELKSSSLNPSLQARGRLPLLLV